MGIRRRRGFRSWERKEEGKKKKGKKFLVVWQAWKKGRAKDFFILSKVYSNLPKLKINVRIMCERGKGS